MADTITPNGSISFTIETGKTLTLLPTSGAKGSVAIFNGQTVDSVEQISGAASKVYGPYSSTRTCRIFAEAGEIDYNISGSVTALGLPGAPVISDDRKTISGVGVKPGSSVPIYDVDTGVAIGSTQALADGSWTLKRGTALAAGTRVGYDPTIVGPYAVAGSGTGGGTGTGTGTGAGSGTGTGTGSGSGTGTGTGTGSNSGGSTTKPDPAVAAAAVQSQSRAAEVSSADSDTGRASSGSGPFTALARPVISGKRGTGQTLVAYPGLFEDAAGTSYTWTADGLPISGQTSRKYVEQASVSDKALGFTVTASDGTASSAVALPAPVANKLLLEDGTDLLMEDGTPFLLDERVLRWLAPYSASQSTANKFANPTTTAVHHAVDDLDIFVAPTKLPVSLYAPGAKILNILHSGSVKLSLVPDADGYCQGILPLTGLANGPLLIQARALYDVTDESISTTAFFASINVIIRGGTDATIPAVPTPAQGMTLYFSEDFSAPLSISASRTRPDGVKWFGGDAFHPSQGYGDSIFTDPNGPNSQFKIVDGVLRIRSIYDPVTAATYNDDYNRKWLSGCMTSSFPDGKTSVPDMGNGYYECRMLCPIDIGTWPAFWLNDQANLEASAAGTPLSKGRETDVMEQYNETPGYVSTQHRYETGRDDNATGINVAGNKGQMGWAWRRFGCLVTDDKIVYYLDDEIVGTDNSKFHTAGDGKPDRDHILVTMAMGGGWPLAVPPGGYNDLYVSDVRYFK